MTLEIPVKKQNEQLAELITQLKQEKEIILTQDGKPVARLVSIYRQPAKSNKVVHVYSPRLAHSEQIADFKKEMVEELPDADV